MSWTLTEKSRKIEKKCSNYFYINLEKLSINYIVRIRFEQEKVGNLLFLKISKVTAKSHRTFQA